MTRWTVGVIVSLVFVALRAMPAHGELALVGATIYPAPGAPVISNGIVAVRDGRIAAVGS